MSEENIPPICVFLFLVSAIIAALCKRPKSAQGAKFSSLNIVDEGVDTGPVIIQDVVKISNNDTEKTLSKKILLKEHKIYPKAVELFAEKKISIKGRTVKIKN